MISERVLRLKSNYTAHGLRTCVEVVLLVELFKHPHVLLLQYRNSIFKLPGGRLRPGESDIEGLKCKLASKLSVNENVLVPGLEVGECIGMWLRPNFETLMYPFSPPNVKHPKVLSDSEPVRLLNHAVEKIWPICMEQIASQKILRPIIPWFSDKYRPWTAKEALIQHLYLGRNPPLLTDIRVLRPSTGDDHLV
ncbi:unnamed protein product [Eruca vesicaria subsp. sativa]|uniref:Nudix hydrolase domain-containing protein n=1 Tax=Eruca vesicaria subsp. sativa TaxID=29727 RepID=A0ABC8KUZ0_ERUVS|nr:unnamed protein product [Eruca vesicaria subsp. sativa]